MDYFKKAFDFWYDRSFATNAKTIELTTSATRISFGYKLIWKDSENSVELYGRNLVDAIKKSGF